MYVYLRSEYICCPLEAVNCLMSEWMDGWMDGWMDDEWLGGWINTHSWLVLLFDMFPNHSQIDPFIKQCLTFYAAIF